MMAGFERKFSFELIMDPVHVRKKGKTIKRSWSVRENAFAKV